MKRQRRTKRRYAALFDTPALLFGTCEVLLWPNGEPEIWLRSKDGKKGMRLRASEGQAGLGLTIGHFVGTAPLTVNGNAAGPDCEPIHAGDAMEISLTQYNADERSQQFKQWYAGKGPYPT